MTTQHGGAAQGQPFGLLHIQAPEARHQRYHDVGQHRHLQQLDKDLADDFQVGDQLAEKHAGGDAGEQADENACGKRHVYPLRAAS